MECEWSVHDKIWSDDFYLLLFYLNGKLLVPSFCPFWSQESRGAHSVTTLEQSLRPLAPTSSLGSASSTAALIPFTVPGDNRSLGFFLRYHLIEGFAPFCSRSPDDVRAISASRKFPRARMSVRIRGLGC